MALGRDYKCTGFIFPGAGKKAGKFLKKVGVRCWIVKAGKYRQSSANDVLSRVFVRPACVRLYRKRSVAGNFAGNFEKKSAITITLPGLICSGTRKRVRGAKITAALPMASRPVPSRHSRCGAARQSISVVIGRGTNKQPKSH